MRALLYLCGALLLANTALLFWPTTTSRATHVHPESKAINPHFIRLNKEIENKYLDVEPALSDENQFQLTASNDAGCYRLGPFLHRANYELAQAVLFNADIDYQKSTREERRSEVYRIYLGPFASQAEALDKRTELKRAKVLDHFVRKQNNGAYMISLGIYTTRQAANNALSLFDGKLDSVKMTQENLLLPNSYWLHFTVRDEDPLEQQLSLMDWGEQSTKLGKYRCRETQNG